MTRKLHLILFVIVGTTYALFMLAVLTGVVIWDALLRYITKHIERFKWLFPTR